MSYTTADKIIDIYSHLLMNLNKLGFYEKYRFSDLQGYDLIDVSNAIKLMIAYRVFISSDIDESKIEELRKYAVAGSAALLSFLDNFYPDKIVFELNKIDPNDKMAFSTHIEIKKDSEAEIKALLYNEEHPDSFLHQCLLIGRSDSDYWEKIYNRLGITWETNDEYDKIYINIAIKNGTANSNKSSKQINETKSSLGILGNFKKLFRSTKNK